MNSHRFLVSALIAAGLLMLTSWFLIINQLKNRATLEKPAPFVAVTVYPIYDIVRNVVGPEKSVVLIVPPGTDPLNYQVTTGDVVNSQGSIILFSVGHGLDEWAGQLAQQAGIGQVLPVDGNLDFTAHPDTSYYWLSLKNAQTITQNIADILASYDPGNTEGYYARAESYRQELEDLYQYGLGLKQQASTTDMTAAQEWRFLADDFGLNHIDGTPAASLDPYGGSIAADTYLNLMKTNLNILFH